MKYLRSCSKNNISSAKDKLTLYCQLLYSNDYQYVVQATDQERFRGILFLISLY